MKHNKRRTQQVCVIHSFIVCVNAVFRATETSQDVESLRPPRFIHEDGVIRPYKEREGIGSQMLQVTHLDSPPTLLCS